MRLQPLAHTPTNYHALVGCCREAEMKDVMLENFTQTVDSAGQTLITESPNECVGMRDIYRGPAILVF